jgi:hypothetical protein
MLSLTMTPGRGCVTRNNFPFYLKCAETLQVETRLLATKSLLLLEIHDGRGYFWRELRRCC